MLKETVVETTEVIDIANKLSNNTYHKERRFCGILIYSYKYQVQVTINEHEKTKIGFSK